MVRTGSCDMLVPVYKTHMASHHRRLQYSFENLLCRIQFKCTVRFTLQCSHTLWCVLSPTLSLSWSKYTIEYGTHKIDGTCYVEYNLPLWCLLQRTQLFQHYSNVEVRRRGDGPPNLMSQYSYHVVTSHKSWASSSVLPTSHWSSACSFLPISQYLY